MISSGQANEMKQKLSPNILLIVADDMGYADLGCFGSDISTPNIDQLAREGIRFTNFHSAPSCAPTRAALLSGADNHVAGMGSQFIRNGARWGYEGFLTNRVVTIPQVLEESGYQTYLVGKWHLGGADAHLPHNKGFQKSFILLHGAGNHYNSLGFVGPDRPSKYFYNGNVAKWPGGAYSTDLYTDYLLDFIQAGKEEEKPFFAMAAYTSPHWPLQVAPSYWEKYEEKYEDGYEALRARRMASLKEKGIIPRDYPMPPLHPDVTPWDSLTQEEQKIETRKMALYAGMLENLDWNVGRLVQQLKENGDYDNTVIIFMSDNGAAYRDLYNSGSYMNFLRATYDNSYENMGKASSFVSYGAAWAEAGSAPFRYFKQYTYEGGVRVPMVFRNPSGLNPGSLNRSFTTLTDLAPTFYQLAKADYPSTYKGNEVHPLQGTSLMPILNGEDQAIHPEDEAWTLEHHNHVLVHKGNWKLVNPGVARDESEFELYNLDTDPAESKDVKMLHPDIYLELLNHWKAFKTDYQVKSTFSGEE